MSVKKLSLHGRIVVVFALIILIVLSAAGCDQAAASREDSKIVLSLAHFFGATHPAETELVQSLIKEIADATDGRVEIESYPGESLLKAHDIYKGVVDGVAAIGLSCFSYTAGRFPVLEVFELPVIEYKNSKAASMTAWEGIKQIDPEEIKDTKLLMVVTTGPGSIFAKAPVKSLEDMQGLEIRATGVSAETISRLGGIPVGMSQAEAYEALSKGIVKGNLAPVETLKGWKHGEVTKYITHTPFLYNTLFFVTMNLDKWNSLPDDIRKTIEEVAEKVHKEVGIGLWDKQNEAALDWALNEQGMEVFDLSDDEKTKWIEKVSPMLDDYSAKIREKGVQEDVVSLIKDLADKYNSEY